VWKAPLSKAQAGGMFLAILGVLVVLSKGDVTRLGQLEFGTRRPVGGAGRRGWALYTVFNKRLPLPPLPSTVKLAALIGGGALVLAPFAASKLRGQRGRLQRQPRLYIALGFLAVVPSLGAYFCFDRLVRWPARRAPACPCT
jgi:drug/metabolite transporter (DMT)-like permease